MAKIWDKGHAIDALVERFTVGDDYLLDRRLVPADAVASIAHATMLASVGLLTADEAESLTDELKRIAHDGSTGAFTVSREQEDSHTAIEQALIGALGDTGKKIHAGRSRNDQVSASTRLFAREGLLAMRVALLDTIETLLRFAADHESVPMLGRTHLQPAMPSTVGCFAASYADLLLDSYESILTAYRLVNRSPLGAAASYGVPLPLDREQVARLLGFEGVHHNVIAAVGARGHLEFALLGALDQVGLVLSRFATDIILFSTPEFAYFSLPEELTTGSSIMPQKRNADVMELLRAESGVLSSYADRVRAIVRSLPTGYNRDVQETKEPLLRGLDLAIDMLAVTEHATRSLRVDEVKLRESFTADVFAADRALELVDQGMSFRDAYREVAGSLSAIASDEYDIDAAIAKRTATGTPGNLGLAGRLADVDKLRADCEKESQRVRSAITALAGEISLYPGTTRDG
jgi:argininosuccinate lyase